MVPSPTPSNVPSKEESKIIVTPVPSVDKSSWPSSVPSYICEDNRAKFFISKQNQKRTCKWVSKKLTKRRCERFPEVPINCPLLCGNCNDHNG